MHKLEEKVACSIFNAISPSRRRSLTRAPPTASFSLMTHLACCGHHIFLLNASQVTAWQSYHFIHTTSDRAELPLRSRNSLATKSAVLVLLLMASSTVNGLLLGRMREVSGAQSRSGIRAGGWGGGTGRLAGHLRRLGASPGRADEALSLGGVVPSILHHARRGTIGVVVGHILHLGCLGIDNLGRVGQVGVNDFFVVDVDQWAKVGQRGSDEGQAPEWDDLDQPVGEEGSGAGGYGDINVLGEEDPLKFDDEEVDELFDIFK